MIAREHYAPTPEDTMRHTGLAVMTVIAARAGKLNFPQIHEEMTERGYSPTLWAFLNRLDEALIRGFGIETDKDRHE